MKKNSTFKIEQRYLDYFFSINGVNQIIEIFNKEKIEIKFVGGCIRDALLSIKCVDIDFAIKCKPEITVKILKENDIQYDDYAMKYGSVNALINKKKFGITSLRKDIDQTGRQTNIIYTNDWKVDAWRRDFTINSIYLAGDGRIYDYFGGIKDLEKNKIRFIGDIEKRVTEDYLRIFRYYRFLGVFEKPQLVQGYEEVLKRYCAQSFNYLTNDLLRQEILKMFNTSFPLNSFFNNKDNKKKRFWIELTKNHFIKTQYDLGLNKCLNKIDLLIT